MSETGTEKSPEVYEGSEEQSGVAEPWSVILFNDDVHSFDQVIHQVQKATGCSANEAERITFEAHFKGKAVAFRGGFANCYRVAAILREIQLIVEIQG